MWKIAWRNIWRNKRRSLITMASVFFAFFFCVLTLSMQRGVWGQMVENILRTQAGHIQVHQKGYFDDQVIDNLMEMDSRKIQELETLPNVAYVSPRLETFAMAAYGMTTKAVALIGIDPVRENRMSSLAQHIVAGSYLDENDANGVVLGKKLADYLQVTTGDTLALISQGYHGVSANGLFVVRGIVSLITPEMDQGFIYTTIPAAQHFVGLDEGLSGLLITLTDESKLARTLQSVSQHVDTTVYEVLGWKTTMEKLLDQAKSDELFGKILLWVLYVIVGFGVLSTVIMMTNERHHEFGVMVAVGMQRRKLAAVMALEMLLMIALGIAAGLAITVPVVEIFHHYPIPVTGSLQEALASYGMEAVFPLSNDPYIFVEQFIIVAVIAVLVGLYPVRHVLRLNVIKALRA